MADTVWATLKKFGLCRQINAFVMDNATNNDTMVEALEQGEYCFSSRHIRMRCMPHTIHLTAIKVGHVSHSTSHPYQDTVNGVGDSPEDAELWDDEIVADSTTAMDDSTDQQEAACFQIHVRNGEHDIAFAVQKLRRIIKYARSSPQRRKKWKGQIRLNADELGAALAKAELIFFSDIKTRWSSTLRKSEF
ncbi:hypothetical protein B0H14DRAFT_2630820 [Mycena olivaceomarginata]|nr:hypothetical protein B0H14DRAFT_2630820 [Mycena olivaceomarginata]